jgi:hypothetical protein
MMLFYLAIVSTISSQNPAVQDSSAYVGETPFQEAVPSAHSNFVTLDYQSA